MSKANLDIKIEPHVQIGELRKMEDALQREIVRMRALGAATDQLKEKEAALLSVRGKLAASGRGGNSVRRRMRWELPSPAWGRC